MSRLISLVLCLLTASGIYSGSAAASRYPAQAQLAAAVSTVRFSQRTSVALDPARATQGPVLFAPAPRSLAPHALQRHAAGIAAATWTLLALDPARDRSGASRNARWAIGQRGYRATGPPWHHCVSSSRNSLARPA